jgi:hypothetical protein
VRVTICVAGEEHAIPGEDAAALAEQLRLYGTGFRGEVDDPGAALALADAIDARIQSRSREPIRVGDQDALDALHTVLNAVIHEPGPAMKLYGAVAAARQQAG